MRGRTFAALAIVGAVAAFACNALNGSGDLDFSSDDGAAPPPAPPASGDDAGFDAPPEPPFEAGCDSGPCGVTLPAGFSVVLYAADATTTCPTGSHPFDVVTNPNVGPGACTCDTCTVKTKPSCEGGTMATFFDNDSVASCSQVGASLSASGTCVVLSASTQKHALIVAPDAGQDGTCNAPATPNAQAVTTTPARVCASPSCEACGAAGGDLPVCIAGSGDLACPPSLPKKQLVGNSASVACGQCGTCSFTSTCSGAVTFYSDAQCKVALGVVPTGTCEAAAIAGFPFGSYKWAGTAQDASCAASEPPPGSAQLAATKTICCAQ